MRHMINTIQSLISPEGRTIVKDDIKIHVYKYFRQIFRHSENRRISFLKDVWLPQNGLWQLEEDFSEEEVKKVIWDLGQDKALVHMASQYSSFEPSGH